ncbi:MAG: diadenylate cyclase CdaA [Ruminococcus sp.]|nr:diadenylate cyclase CdaA [Ruminococcus sp.]MBQ5317369.1 diadenylate cyclase CdaA [Oscillospiraceae bacterium]
MDLLYDIKNIFMTILPPKITDILDIAILSYAIFKLIQFMKETRAMNLFKGIALLLGVYAIASLIGMNVTVFILGKLFNLGFIALIILFQPELRRSLEKVGYLNISKLTRLGNDKESDSKWESAIDVICDACEDLSSTTTGALIVIERESKLGEQIASGTMINASPSKELFGTIFFPKTPLHDGAVIMRDGIILAAGCFLPKSEDDERVNDVYGKELGSRHRAALGMSENSDALIIIVSEETGTISIVENGGMQRGLSKDNLKKTLKSRLISERPSKNADKNDKKA